MSEGDVGPGRVGLCSWWADLDYANVLYFAFLLFCSMWMFKVRVDFAEVVNSRYYFSCQRRNRNRTEAHSSPLPPHFPIHPMVTRWRSNIIHTHSHLALNCSSCERQFVCLNQLFRTNDLFFHVSVCHNSDMEQSPAFSHSQRHDTFGKLRILRWK